MVEALDYTKPCWGKGYQYLVGGGWNMNLIFHILGESQLTNIFQRGWNHQPDIQLPWDIYIYIYIYPHKNWRMSGGKKKAKKTRCDLLVSCWSNCLFVPSHKSWSSAGRGRGRSGPIQVRQRGAPGGRGWGALILFFGDGCGPRRFGLNRTTLEPLDFISWFIVFGCTVFGCNYLVYITT